jgi:hypothetical protein
MKDVSEPSIHCGLSGILSCLLCAVRTTASGKRLHKARALFLPFFSFSKRLSTPPAPLPLKPSTQKPLYHVTSVISTVKLPYIRGTVPERDDEDGVYSLKQRHAYKIGRDHHKDLTVFSVPTKGASLSVKGASQLDRNMAAARYGWHNDTVLTLVTRDGEHTIGLGSHFITDFENNVRWPDPKTLAVNSEVPPSSHSTTKASNQQ